MIPRRFYAQEIVRAENIVGLQDAVKEVSPRNVDGGELRMMMMGLSSEDMDTILKAAEIIRKLQSPSGDIG